MEQFKTFWREQIVVRFKALFVIAMVCAISIPIWAFLFVAAIPPIRRKHFTGLSLAFEWQSYKATWRDLYRSLIYAETWH